MGTGWTVNTQRTAKECPYPSHMKKVRGTLLPEQLIFQYICLQSAPGYMYSVDASGKETFKAGL